MKKDGRREEKRPREKEGGREIHCMYKLRKEKISHIVFNKAQKKVSRIKFLKVKDILLYHV